MVAKFAQILGQLLEIASVYIEQNFERERRDRMETEAVTDLCQ